ncbi:MAG: TolC family protein [Candidatus Tectimicrobiota bacterium]
MSLTSLAFLGAALAFALAGCAPAGIPQSVWPEPRPLGEGIPSPSYQPSPPVPGTAPPAPAVTNPSGVLTLPHVQALALLQHPRLAAFAWEARAGEARTLQASLAPNPTLGIEVEDFAGSGTLRGLRGTEITIHLSQLIELAGKRQKRTRVAALERDLVAWDYEAARIEVLTQATQAFVEVLSAQERLRLNRESVRLAEDVLRTAAERVRAGKVSPVEETRAQVALSTSRIAAERSQRELDAARQRLVVFWDGRSPAFDSAAGPLEPIDAIPSAAHLAERLAQNPDIARWVTEMAQRQAALDLADAQRVPDPTIGGGFRHARETGDNALVMQFSIPLPVFNRNQGGVLEARYRLAKAAEERRTAERQVRTALAEAYGALASAFVEATRLRDEVLPGAQGAFDAISEGYRQGKFGFLDVLDAQRTLFESRGRYLEVLVAYHRAVAEVERVIGEPLGAAVDAPPVPRNGGTR